jgi:hypothetical protein
MGTEVMRVVLGQWELTTACGQYTTGRGEVLEARSWKSSRPSKKWNVPIVPSIWPENSPVTIQEAFLCGMSVVASNIGGMAELVDDGRNGLLFKVGGASGRVQ